MSSYEIVVTPPALFMLQGQVVALGIVPGGIPAVPAEPPPQEADPTVGWGLMGYVEKLP